MDLKEVMQSRDGTEFDAEEGVGRPEEEDRGLQQGEGPGFQGGGSTKASIFDPSTESARQVRHPPLRRQREKVGMTTLGAIPEFPGRGTSGTTGCSPSTFGRTS